ncbi:hypothetical protein DF222_05475 [Corynebacterium yudongzhengii]|uniref:Uncharacterized protein n=1 Tax=Corynebacterium yudongzhengii TaxID=2080740 RepID=A0A2U1T730_9CORY|nr:hypothetical protein DF222_05475 [Corynebacterium yudongzhengii]
MSAALVWGVQSIVRERVQSTVSGLAVSGIKKVSSKQIGLRIVGDDYEAPTPATLSKDFCHEKLFRCIGYFRTLLI